MKMPRRALMAGSVFALALATGYVMQNGDALASRFAGSSPEALATTSVGPMPIIAPQPTPVSVVGSADGSFDMPLPIDPAFPVLSALSPADLPGRIASVEADPAALAREPLRQLSEFGLPCEVQLAAREEVSGMVRLMLDAPCYAGSPVTIRHEGLKFTEATSDTGRLQVSVPALALHAEFTIGFDDGSKAVASVDVPAAQRFEHVVLQSVAGTMLEIHAREFGAYYGEAGHVHLGAAHGPERALHQGRGFLTALGDGNVPGAWTAQVYSFPSGDSVRSGAVRISIETEISTANCGREMQAETLQPGPDGLSAVELTLFVPACDAIGDILVLKNALRDMKIAAN